MKRKKINIKEVRKFYKTFYDKGDGAHNISHPDTVCENILMIDNKLGLNLNTRVLVLSAYIHDIGRIAKNGAKLHHLLGHSYVLDNSDKLLQECTENERHRIAIAVVEHRASFKGSRSSLYSEVLSCADIGEVTLESSVGRSKHHTSHDAKVEFLKHLKDKFGRKGYTNFPIVYDLVYPGVREKMIEDVENLTLDELSLMIDNFNK